MEVDGYILCIIFGAAVVTFIPRVLPLMILSRMTIPDWGKRWLNYIPIAVMAALVGQELFVSDETDFSLLQNQGLWAAIPTFLVAIWTRSLLATVVIGILSTMIIRAFFF